MGVLVVNLPNTNPDIEEPYDQLPVFAELSCTMVVWLGLEQSWPRQQGALPSGWDELFKGGTECAAIRP